jgi:hypothetical protein
MEDWIFDDGWDWEGIADYHEFLQTVTESLADQFFLSDNKHLPDAGENYNLGYLEPEDWWPLINQLGEMVNLETIVDLTDALDALLRLPGLPTELLEDPLVFLQSVLEGSLPPEPSGRRVNSRRLVKIALVITRLLQEFPVAAQAAVRAWANVHRGMIMPFPVEAYGGEEMADLLFAPDLPPAVTGFGLVLTMTLMQWPERADGRMPLPPGFLDPGLLDELFAQWEALPHSPTVTEEGVGEAEALFAQGQLAHVLAQLGTVEGLDPDQLDEEEVALSYSRLSRAILWLHHQCRHCPQRQGVACGVATGAVDHPAPLLDLAGEIANTGRIEDCVRM